MTPNDGIDLIVVKTDMGTEPVYSSECAHSPKTKPLFEEMQALMERRGWVGADHKPIIDDLNVGTRIWQDSSDGHYYFGLRAYRGSNPPADANHW